MKCRPWSHDYGNWEDLHEYALSRAPTDREFSFTKVREMVKCGTVLIQVKKCQKCGKKKSREISI